MMNDYNSLSSGIFASLKRTIQKKATWLLFFVLFSFVSVQGQVTVTGAVTGNGTYTTLSAAFTAIPVAQVGANITVTITGDTSEPATGATLAAGTWTSLTIAPAGGPWTISGAATAGTPLITFNGSDKVTVNGGGNLTFANTTVSSTTGTSTLKLTGDATYNTFNNLNILGSAIGSTGSNCANVWISTGTTSGNDFNAFQSCKFGPAGVNLPGQLLVANGSTTSNTIQNSNITINNCEFSDYFQAATASAAIYMSTGNTAWTVTNNKIFQTAARTITTAQTDYGIYMVNAGGTAYGESFVITGNTIGYASNSGTGTMTYASAATAGGFTAINFSASAVTANTNTISNNIISDIQWTSTAGSTFTGISSNGLVNTTTGAVFNITGNTVRNIATVTTTGTMIGIYAGYAPTTAISSNTINNITRTGSGTIYGIQYTGAATTTATLNANSVTNIANNNATSASSLYGIYSGSSPANEIWTNNTIDGLSSISTGGVAIYAIYSTTATTGNKTCQNNIVRNFSLAAGSTGTIGGIRIGYLGATNIFSGNTIYNFTGGTNLYGLYVGGSSAATVTVENVYNNKIYGLTSSVGTPAVYGLYIAGGITNNVYNNLVGNLSTPFANTATAMYGIYLSAGTTDNVYYNTVKLSGTSSGSNFGSAAVYATATPTTIDLRNNIFVNSASANGTGRAVAFQRSAAALTNYATTCNNNLFYGTTAAYFDGTTAYAPVAFQAFVAPRESASRFQNPAFASTTGADATFLHFADGAVNLAGGFASPISGFTSDFDGNTRDASTPDIGADEWNNGTIVAPTITGFSTAYSPFAPIYLCSNGGSVVTITGTSLDTVSSVLFNGGTGVNLVGTITAQTTTSLTVTAPADVVDGVIRVTNPAGFTDSVATFVTALPPTVGVSAPVTICSGTSTSLVATGGNTYTWSPSTGLALATGDTVAASPTATTTYTVTGITTAGCMATNSVSVTVNPTPSAITVTKNPTQVCLGGVSTLTASGGLVGGTMQGVIGTGTSTTSASASYAPFNGYRSSEWSQTIFTAAELTAAGLTAGNIRSIAYNINSQGSSTSNNITIKIGSTATSAFANTTLYNTAGYTTVFGPSAYTHTASGWQTINFANPYIWDGTSNIVVDVWQDGPNSSADPLTYYTAAADNKANYTYNVSPSVGAVGTLTVNRFNVTFAGTNSVPTTLAWTPSTDLYTNVAATTAYAGQNLATVYTKSLDPQTYTVTATLGSCSSTSSVTVTPNPLPTIAATGTTNCGTTGSAITATGGVSYVWSPALGLNGTTGASVTASPAVTSTYTVTGTDANGCVNTATALVTVNNPVAITTLGQPANAVVLVGDPATFTVTATGTGLTYQWQVNDSTGWADILGATAATYTTAATTMDQNNYQFRCVVSGAAPCTPVTTNAANLTVGTVSIVTQPAPQTICSNDTATYTVVTGGEVLSYQWQYSTNGSTWSDLTSADATTATITLSGLTSANSLTQYHCVLNAGQVTSNPVLLTVSDAVAIGTQPTSQSVCNGVASVTFTAAATGTGLTYQWQMSTNGTSWTNVSGATATTYTINNPTIALNGRQYKVIVSGISPCAAVTSDVATLTVTGVTVSASAPAICIGAPVTLSAVYTGTPGTTTSSWVCATANSGATTAISGDSATVTPTAAGTYVYTFATNGTCSFTPTVSVTVNPLPIVTAVTASPASICSGGSVSLAATSISNGPTTTPTYAAPPGVTYPTSDEDFAGIVIKQGTTTILSNTSANNSLVGTIGTATGTAGSYSNFTSFGPYSLTAANAYTFTVSSSTSATAYSNALAIYIDYNRNGVFTDAGEQVYTSSATTSGAHSENGSFTVPANVSAGYTRMRVISNEGLISSPTQAVSYGEYEEYTINLLGNVSSTYAWSWNTTPAVTAATGTTTITNTSGAAVTQAFTATATIAATGCTNSLTTSAVNINTTIPTPVATNSVQCGSQTPTCSVTGTGTIGNKFKWYTVATGGTALTGQIASTLVSYPVAATTTFYVAEVSADGLCESPRVAVTVTANTPYPFTLSATAVTNCSGFASLTPVTIATNGGYSSYSWTNSTTVSGDATTGWTFSPTATTTYTVTATDGLCSATANVVVTPTALPNVTIAANPTNICVGASTSLTALSLGYGPTTAPTYTAPPAVTYAASDEDFAGIVIKQGTTTILSNTSANNSLVGTIGTATGTAGSYSNFTSFGPYALTAGQAYTFTATSSTSGTAYSNALAVYIDYNRNGVFTDAGEQVYTSAATTSGAHSENGSFTVPAGVSAGYTRMRVISNEGLISSPTQAVSYGEYEEYTINLLGNAPSTYACTWNDPAATTGNTLTVTPATTTAYTVSAYSAATGCTGTATSTITVYPFPTAPSVTSAPQCGTRVPTIAVADTNGYTAPTFKWYADETTTTALQTSTSTTYTTSVSATTTFYVSVVSPGGCESPRAAVTTTVIAPAVLTVSPAVTICTGASTTLTADGAVSYTWTPALGLNGTTGSSVIASPSATTTYSVTGVDSNSCTTAAATVKVTVAPYPAAVTITQGAASVCTNSVMSLTATGGAIGSQAAVGPASPTAEGGSISATAYGIGTYYQTFDVLAPTSLASVDVFPTAAIGSTASISIADSTGTILNTVPYTTTVTNGDMQTVALNIPLAVGTGYRIGQGGTAITLNRNYSNAVYPYTCALANITGNNFATNYFYYFYNMQFSTFVPTTITWSPSTNLYSDAAATVAYTGANTNVVYTRPTDVITYTATAANGACTTPATTTVTPVALPVFTVSSDVTVCRGTATTLEALGSGYTYVWTPALGLNGTTTASVSATPMVTTTYSVEATDSVTGCKSTKSVTVTVINPGAILTVGTTTTQTVVPGQSATFTVATATGATYTYQWQVNNGSGWVNLTDAGNYSGATTASLVVSNIDPTFDNYHYQCLVTGASPCSTLTPVVATLNVSNTGFASQPSDVTICNGGATAFSITTSGDDPFSVQWQMSTDNGVTFADITNGTNANGLTFANTDQLTLNVSGITLANSGVKFTCIVNSYITSNPATLTVKAPVVITTQPANQSVCVNGGIGTFTVAATGADLAYQWQYSTNGTTWSNYTGADATTASISIVNPALAANGTQYQVIVSGNAACSSVTSSSATLNINNPTITSAPVAVSVIRGNTATLTVAASAATSYQWQRSTTLSGTYSDVVDGTPVGNSYLGNTTASLSVVTSGATVLGGGNYYRSIANNNGCYVTSTGALLTVTDYCASNATSDADEEISNVTLGSLNNSSACGDIAPGSGSVAYRYSNYTNGNGAPQAPDLIRSAVIPFSLTQTTCGGNYSNKFAIFIDWNQDGDFADAGETAFQQAAAGSGNNTQTGTITVPATATLGNTRMRVINVETTGTISACGTYSWGETEDYLVNILPTPACDGTPVAGIASVPSASMCAGNATTISLNGSSTGVLGITYQWYYSANGTTFAPIAGATSTSLPTGNLTADAYYYCTVTCTNSTLSVNSNTVALSVANPLVAGTTPGGRCGAGTVVLGATANAGATVNWYAAPTNGLALGSGTSFTTPSITATTTYYAEAVTGGGSGFAGGSYSGTSNNGTSVGSHGISITTTVPNVKINSIDIPFTGTGTITVALRDASNVTTYSTTTSSTVTGAGTTAVTVPFNITVPTAGSYTLIVTAVSGVSALGYATVTYPSSALAGSFSVTSGYWYGASTSSMYLFNLNVSTGCSSTRTAVVATVDPTPTATISYAGAPFCNNAAVGSVTLTGTNAYTGGTYTSTTGLGLNGTTGDIDPSASTPGTYVVTYTTNATTYCTPQTATTTVVINESVLYSGFTYASASYCNNSGIVTPTITGTPGTFTVSPSTGLTVNATTGAINFATATPGTYTVTNTVTACNNFSTTDVTIAVYPAAVIPTQPTSVTACAGSTSSMTVAATGTNVAYQWQMSTNGTSWSNVTDGGVYSGATTATLAFTGVTASMTGYQFKALVSDANPCTAVASSAATLTVSQPATPVITPNPANVCAGGVTALTVNDGAFLTNSFDVLPSNFTTSGSGVSATLNTTYYSEGTGSVLINAGTSANVAYSLNTNINLNQVSNAILTFSHICASEAGYDYGYVQYSADGGTTWTSFPTSSYTGTATLKNGVVSFDKSSYTDWGAALTGSTSLPTNALWKTETINLPAAALTSQFRLRFRYTTDSSVNYYGWLIDNVSIATPNTVAWSPVTGLYTNAAATTAYTGGNVATVYTKPTASTSYTVTSTNALGCSSSASVDVTILAPSTLGSITQPSVTCSGSQTTFNLTGLLANSTSTINYTINGVAQTAITGVVADASGNASFTVALPAANNGRTLAITTIKRTDLTPNCPTTITANNTVVIAVSPLVTYFADADGDGFGNNAVTQVSCQGAPTGFVSNNADCDDTNAAIHAMVPYYVDADGDGYGSVITASFCTATAPAGYSVNNTDCNDTVFSANNICPSVVNLKFNIEGYYNTATQSMVPVKANQLVAGATNTDVDDVTVELRSAADGALVDTAIAALKTNGTAVATFATGASGSYYLVVKYKNAIETWSATPQSVGLTPLTYNFTNAASKAYGNNMKQVSAGVYAIYSGDINLDSNIDNLDYSTWEEDANNLMSGYFATDLNGDGNVDNLDYSIWETNSNNFVYSITPF